MKKIRAIILCCFLVAAVSCTPRGIIPKRKMAAIHADMFLLDQYAGSDNKLRRFTDTCAMYKPLLRSYGYTADDYFRSIDHYMENTRDMEEILNMTEKILKKREDKILRHIETEARKTDTASVKKPRRHPKSTDEEMETMDEND